jgi:hypothetical protein
MAADLQHVAPSPTHIPSEEITMGLFGKILEKLGIGDDDKDRKPSPTPSPTSGGTATRTRTTAPAAPAPPRAMAMADVVSQLEKRAAANPQKLNWRTSIVDLLKLLDIDSSLESRKELATELGAPAQVMNDSAQMNTWLHRTVLGRIAANGGNVPRELLD